jgi:4-hydroxythreonine-4-phosphate dehydrogenase
MMPRPILILADDLSGAADCAVACAKVGLMARVCLDGGAPQSPVDALALDLDTRQRPAQAARTATLAVQGLVQGRVLYRKIDSTLRGHIGIDVAATLQIAGPGAFAIICPAYPAMGRTVTDGQVHVRGAPLADTEIWRNDGSGDAELRAMLAAEGLAVAHIPLKTVHGDLCLALSKAVAGGGRALICDAETEADLEALVAAGLSMAGAVWVGSGGMAIPLAAALAPEVAAPRLQAYRRRGPHLVVAGSANSVTHGQIAELARDPGVILVKIPPAALLAGPDGPGWRPASRALAAAVGKAGKDVVAAAIDPDAPIDPVNGARLAAALGALVGRQLSRFGSLTATGGETARGVLQAAGAHSLRMEREIEPGIPLSILEDQGLPVITKAGAFGHPQSLARCVAAMRALPLASPAQSGASVTP